MTMVDRLYSVLELHRLTRRGVLQWQSTEHDNILGVRSKQYRAELDSVRSSVTFIVQGVTLFMHTDMGDGHSHWRRIGLVPTLAVFLRWFNHRSKP